MRNDDLRPPTDEFGREDPDVLERERRRAEREKRRKTRTDLGATVGKKREPKARRGKPAPMPEPAEPRPPRPGLADRAAAMRGRIPKRTPREPRTARPRSYWRRRIFALTGVLAAVLLAWFLIAFFQPFAGDGKGTGTVSVTVPQGASAGEVAGILADEDVVSSGTLFEWRLKLAGKSDKILPGSYVLAHGMSYATAIDKLTGTSGEISALVPEGLSRPQIAEIASEDGLSGDYEAASTSAQGFDPAAYGAQSPPSLEGFLFPATYKLDQGADVKVMVQEQLNAFQQNIKGVDMSYARKKNLTVYDVLKIASMIEDEAGVARDRPLIAAVIYNRLKQGIPLGIDATVRFATGNYDQPLTTEQLNSNSPYNTRKVQGLPPTPIGNPGIAAIKAAASPAKVPYLYYVNKPNTCGELTFSTTLEEHNAAVAAYNAAREANGGNEPSTC